MRILSVDDEEVNQEIVRSIFESEGVEVVIAMECLDEVFRCRVAGQMPDMILLDSKMPNLTGLDVCRRLRQDFNLVDLPIIMVTGRAHLDEIASALHAGCNDYVTKPFDRAQILARVNVQKEVLKCIHARESALKAQVEKATKAAKASADAESTQTCATCQAQLGTGNESMDILRSEVATLSRWLATSDEQRKELKQSNHALSAELLEVRRDLRMAMQRQAAAAAGVGLEQDKSAIRAQLAEAQSNLEQVYKELAAGAGLQKDKGATRVELAEAQRLLDVARKDCLALQAKAAKAEERSDQLERESSLSVARREDSADALRTQSDRIDTSDKVELPVHTLSPPQNDTHGLHINSLANDGNGSLALQEAESLAVLARQWGLFPKSVRHVLEHEKLQRGLLEERCAASRAETVRLRRQHAAVVEASYSRQARLDAALAELNNLRRLVQDTEDSVRRQEHEA